MTLSGPTLASLLDDRGNSLTVVRLLAAVAVVVSHSFPIVIGVGAKEPLASLTPFNLGQHAVNVFFVISGFTLANSIERRPELASFIAARILRIFPGVFVLGVVFAFGFGPLLSTCSARDYFSDAHTWLYPFSILIQFNDATPPHGLFESVPYAGNVNEPLWTIRYELAAYVGLAGMAALGLLRAWSALAASIFAALTLYGLVTSFPKLTGDIQGFYNLARFALCFLFGAVACRLKDRIRLSVPFAAVALGAGALWTSLPGASVVWMFVVGYLVFCVGAIRPGPVGKWFDRNDMSYGTYLYGWPIQQTLVTLIPGLGVASLIFLAVPLAMTAGFLSWTLIERPALRLKRGAFASSAPEAAGRI